MTLATRSWPALTVIAVVAALTNSATAQAEAPPNHCVGTDACLEEGRCTPRDGVCVASWAEDCLRSEICREEAKCTPLEGRCLRLGPRDCWHWDECTDGGECFWDPEDNECTDGDPHVGLVVGGALLMPVGVAATIGGLALRAPEESLALSGMGLGAFAVSAALLALGTNELLSAAHGEQHTQTDYAVLRMTLSPVASGFYSIYGFGGEGEIALGRVWPKPGVAFYGGVFGGAARSRGGLLFGRLGGSLRLLGTIGPVHLGPEARMGAFVVNHITDSGADLAGMFTGGAALDVDLAHGEHHALFATASGGVGALFPAQPTATIWDARLGMGYRFCGNVGCAP